MQGLNLTENMLLSIINILTFNPHKAFADIAQSQKRNIWVMPLGIMLMFCIVGEFIIVSAVKVPNIMQTWAVDMDEERVSAFVDWLTSPQIRAVLATFIIAYWGIILAVKSAILQMLLQAFGGDSPFENIFTVVCYASTVLVIRYLIVVPLAIATQTPSPYTSLSIITGETTPHWLCSLLSGVDLFILWDYILCAIGISVTAKINIKRAMGVTGILYLLNLLVIIVIGRML